MKSNLDLAWKNYRKLSSRTDKSIEFLEYFFRELSTMSERYDRLLHRYRQGENVSIDARSLCNGLTISFRALMDAFAKLGRQDALRYSQTGTLSQASVAARNKLLQEQDRRFTTETGNLYVGMHQSLETMRVKVIYE